MTDTILFTILADAFWSGIAASGFAILFNAPRRFLLFCFLTGALGHSIRTLLLQSTTLSIVASTFLASIAVGLAGFILARRLKTPSLIFSVTGLIPMVPGTFAYRAMIALVSIPASLDDPVANATLIDTALTNLIQTGLILGALGMGIATPALLFERTKPVV